MKRRTEADELADSNALFEQQKSFDFGPARPSVREARPGERRSVIEVLGRAFYDDPVSMYLFPKDAARVRGFGRFCGLALETFGADGLVMTNEGIRGAAIWQRPSPKAAGGLSPLSLGIRLAWTAGRRLPQVLRLGDLTHALHPDEPHYYLATLGTDPSCQGQGIGSALIQPILARCDKESTPAYLESSKRENIPFYNKHGFEVMDEVEIPNGPKLWPMIRRTG
jgi:ribosomal protein S18 acetylase RimI-like enzyme